MTEDLSSDEQFHYNRGGYSHDPETETAGQGRVRCAREAARAEAEAERRGWSVRWENDWEADHREYGYPDGQPASCERAVLHDEKGDVLGSIGCIDDASAAVRRVIAAHLAREALPTLRRTSRTRR